MKKTVIVIAGPTASGKSSIGIKLAQRLNGVVISADSMQIYKKLDIGTAKVTDKEAEGIKHELIDIVDINESFSVSDFKNLCYEKIEEIFNLNKVPIIVGGTGLYINAVINNMDFEIIDKEKEELINEKLKELTENKTNEQLLDILSSLDKIAVQNIDKNNTKRLIRAIKLSLMGTNKSDINKRNDLWNKNDSNYNFLLFYVDMPRDLLYDRINKRVDLMIADGVLDEVKLLYNLKDKENITALQAIGYKEFFPYLEKTRSLDECIEVLKQKTRNYAKRQITWFKKIKEKYIIDGTKTKDEIVDNILKEYYGEN